MQNNNELLTTGPDDHLIFNKSETHNESLNHDKIDSGIPNSVLNCSPNNDYTIFINKVNDCFTNIQSQIQELYKHCDDFEKKAYTEEKIFNNGNKNNEIILYMRKQVSYLDGDIEELNERVCDLTFSELNQSDGILTYLKKSFSAFLQTHFHSIY